MTHSYGFAGLLPVALLILICLYPAQLVMPVSAADAEIDAELGDTITISGASYVSDRIYLFFTGPGLPANGVPLTDPTQRADQGQFTIVEVGSDQTWSMRWDTSRLSSVIKPGTYIVYATTEPVDKAHLGGTGTYKTLDVWLRDPKASRVSIGGPSYTLNPEKHSSTQVWTPVFTSPPTPPATTVTTAATTAPPVPAAPTKTGLLPVTSLLAVLLVFAISMIQGRSGTAG